VIHKWTLESGARLVVEDIPYLRSAALGVFIQVGSRNEPNELAGASHFVEHMLFKGTPRMNTRQIAEAFEGMGGQLNAFTAKEFTCVYARTLDEDIIQAMDIIFDMVFCSQFSPQDFATEKGVVMEEINMYEDSPDDLIHDVFTRKLWEGHPMGMPILGTMDSITEMDRDQLYQYYRQHYVPANMIVALAGNVDPREVYNKVNTIMNEHKVPPVQQEKKIPVANEPFIVLVPKEIEQVQICIGTNSVSYHDEDRYTQNVLNSILGGGMSSRLFQRLREELGLAYSVFSSPGSYSDTGIFSIYIGTGQGKVLQFYEALYHELQDIIDHGVSRAEVERTQKLIKSSIFLGLESAMNRMSRLAKSVLMFDEIISPEAVIEKIYAVDEKKVHDYAVQILNPDKLSMAAIGDQKILPAVQDGFIHWWGERS
jgi:predicted Zn-dependent peptidase